MVITQCCEGLQLAGGVLGPFSHAPDTGTCAMPLASSTACDNDARLGAWEAVDYCLAPSRKGAHPKSCIITAMLQIWAWLASAP